jgi:hypothetical protein
MKSMVALLAEMSESEPYTEAKPLAIVEVDLDPLVRMMCLSRYGPLGFDTPIFFSNQRIPTTPDADGTGPGSNGSDRGA